MALKSYCYCRYSTSIIITLKVSTQIAVKITVADLRDKNRLCKQSKQAFITASVFKLKLNCADFVSFIYRMTVIVPLYPCFKLAVLFFSYFTALPTTSSINCKANNIHEQIPPF